MGLPTDGRNEDLQERVAAKRFPGQENLNDKLDASGNDGAETNETQVKQERKCWNRGNWLSCLSNIAGKI